MKVETASVLFLDITIKTEFNLKNRNAANYTTAISKWDVFESLPLKRLMGLMSLIYSSELLINAEPFN